MSCSRSTATSTGRDARARELRGQRGRPHRLSVPATPRARCRCSSPRGCAGATLLFLGYAVDDWSLRVFLRRVWGGDRLAYRSWAVQPAAEHVARELLARARRDVYDVALDGYAEELARLTAALAGDGRGVMRPRSRPYKGSRASTTPIDERFFFGRERESEVVAANLVASRLTVLYGPERRRQELAAARVVVAASARSSRPPAVAARRRCRRVDRRLLARRPDSRVRSAAGAELPRAADPLADALAERGGGRRRDLPGPRSDGGVRPLPRADDGGPLRERARGRPDRPTLPVHVLLGVRDDSLAELDALKGRVAGLFGNVLRLDHLDFDAARAGDRGAARAYEAIGGREVDGRGELVDAVLDQVASGRIERPRRPRDRGRAGEARAAREAPYLQLVMSGSGRSSATAGPTVLRAETLAELGGAERHRRGAPRARAREPDRTDRELVAGSSTTW